MPSHPHARSQAAHALFSAANFVKIPIYSAAPRCWWNNSAQIHRPKAVRTAARSIRAMRGAGSLTVPLHEVRAESGGGGGEGGQSRRGRTGVRPHVARHPPRAPHQARRRLFWRCVRLWCAPPSALRLVTTLHAVLTPPSPSTQWVGINGGMAALEASKFP